MCLPNLIFDYNDVYRAIVLRVFFVAEGTALDAKELQCFSKRNLC